MTKNTTEQELILADIVQGNRYGLVITGAKSNVTLMFKHAGDPTWRTQPDFAGTAAGDGSTVIQADFFCVTPNMKIVLAAPQATKYYVSYVPAAMANF